MTQQLYFEYIHKGNESIYPQNNMYIIFIVVLFIIAKTGHNLDIH